MDVDRPERGVRIEKGSTEMKEYPIGNTVRRAPVAKIEVPEYHRMVIHRGASLGVKDKTSIFHAGIYNDTWMYGKWLHRDEPKLISVEPTGIREKELLTCIWWQKARDGRPRHAMQKFEPGDFDTRKGDFKNDVFEEVILPQDATAILFENSDHGGRYIELENPGHHILKMHDLSHLISSVVFKLDEWEEVSQKLGVVLGRNEIGQPITIPFKSDGLPGAVLHPFVNLGRTKEAETNWHLNQRVGFSATVGTGESSPVKAEFTVSTETEAGGGGAEKKAYTEGAGVTIDAAADDEGILSGFILAQLYEGEQQVFRTLKNKRTGDTTQDEGEITGQFYGFEVHFEHGKAP